MRLLVLSILAVLPVAARAGEEAAGALPVLEFGPLKVDGCRVVGTILQAQEGAPLALRILLRVTTEQALEWHEVESASRESVFALTTGAPPRLLEIDPGMLLQRDVRRAAAERAPVTPARRGATDSLLEDLLFLADPAHAGGRPGTMEAYRLANHLRGRLYKAGLSMAVWPAVAVPAGRLAGERTITLVDGDERVELRDSFYPFHRSASPRMPAVFDRVLAHPAAEVAGALVLLDEEADFATAQRYAEAGAAAVAVVSKDDAFTARGVQAAWTGALPASVAEGSDVSALMARSAGRALPVPYLYVHPAAAGQLRACGGGGVIRFEIVRETKTTSNIVGALGEGREPGILLCAPWDGSAASRAAAVAIVIWVAEQLKRDFDGGRLGRPVLVALLGGEEAGRCGSRQFLEIARSPEASVGLPRAALAVMGAGGPLRVVGSPALAALFDGADGGPDGDPFVDAGIETVRVTCEVGAPAALDIAALRETGRRLYRAVRELAAR